jgi:hypothetical protein
MYVRRRWPPERALDGLGTFAAGEAPAKGAAVEENGPQCDRRAMRSVVREDARELCVLHEHIGCPVCQFANGDQARPIEVTDTSQPNAIHTARLHRSCWQRVQIPYGGRGPHEWRREPRIAHVVAQ